MNSPHSDTTTDGIRVQAAAEYLAQDNLPPEFAAADHGSKPTEGKPLLHRGQHLLFPIALAKDHTVWMEPCLGDSREKQVRPRHAPEHLAS